MSAKDSKDSKDSKASTVTTATTPTLLSVISKEKWQDATPVKECTICAKKFGFTVRKYHCASCGCVCCSTCHSWRKIPNCARVCSNCVNTHINGGYKGLPLLCAPTTLSLDLSNKVYAVTGGNGGIGFEVTKQLAKQGAKVLMCSRSQDRAEAAIAKIINELPNAQVDFVKLDLADLTSVRACAATIIETCDHLDALINNAGIMMVPEGKTKDGFELQFGVCHLGPFLLTHLLLPLLKTSAPSRIVNCSSVAHASIDGSEMAHIDFDDLMYTEKEYNKDTAYQQAKLANLLHAKHLAVMMTEEKVDITVVSHHPGWVATNLVNAGFGFFGKALQNYVLQPLMSAVLTPFEGAQSTLHCVLDPSVVNHSGEFYSQTGFYTSKSCQGGGFPMESPNPEAKDFAIAARLYAVSMGLVKVEAWFKETEKETEKESETETEKESEVQLGEEEGSEEPQIL